MSHPTASTVDLSAFTRPIAQTIEAGLNHLRAEQAKAVAKTAPAAWKAGDHAIVGEGHYDLLWWDKTVRLSHRHWGEGEGAHGPWVVRYVSGSEFIQPEAIAIVFEGDLTPAPAPISGGAPVADEWRPTAGAEFIPDADEQPEAAAILNGDGGWSARPRPRSRMTS